MKWYLVFDEKCPTCRRVATELSNSSTQLEIISIYAPQAISLLNEAYPKGWIHAPYLLAVKTNEVRGWTGAGLTLKLVKLLGIKGAWRAWSIIRQSSISIRQKYGLSIMDRTRRRLVTTGFGIGFAALLTKIMGLSVFETRIALAETCPCNPCGGIGYVTATNSYCGCLTPPCPNCQGCNNDRIREVTCFMYECGYRVCRYTWCDDTASCGSCA